jgi:acyl carrier protein
MSKIKLNKKNTYSEILKLIQEILISENKLTIVDEKMQLIGGDRILDSMKLVELCIALEDKALEIGFEFDWTSDSAMSKSRSMFKTAGTLIEEFINQASEKL